MSQLVPFSSYGTEDYNRIYEDHKSRIVTLKTPCDQLNDLRTTLVKLGHTRKTYWPRPCLGGWPCIGTQHRYEIDKICDELDPVRRNLERDCKFYMTSELTLKASSAASHSSSTAVGQLKIEKIEITVPSIEP